MVRLGSGGYNLDAGELGAVRVRLPASVRLLLPRGSRTLQARALLRNRVGLTDDERDLLEAAVAERAPRKLLDAVLTVTVPDEPDVTFHPAPDPDVAAMSLARATRAVAVRRHEDIVVAERQGAF